MPGGKILMTAVAMLVVSAATYGTKPIISKREASGGGY